ncbi:MAG: DUF4124 domain-containing protein [Pseudomonadales bacterium]
MIRTHLPTALALFAIVLATLAGNDAAAATKIYRTVDEDGNVVFTDVPPRNAEPETAVEVETPNSFAPPDIASEGKSVAEWLGNDGDPEEAEEGTVTSYQSLRIASPANDEPLRDNAGNVSVSAAIEPALGAGHVMQLYLDGKLAETGTTTSFQLSNVDRGTHNIRIAVVDATGSTLISSEPTVFHLQRRSVILQPARSKKN